MRKRRIAEKKDKQYRISNVKVAKRLRVMPNIEF